MKKRLNKIIFMGIILGFVSCNKQHDAFPVATSMAIENESQSNVAEEKKEAIERLKKIMNEKELKYTKLVTVKSKSGTYYANYQLCSDNKDVLDRVFDKYQNATIKMEEKEKFFSQNIRNTSTPDLENSFDKNSIALMPNDKAEKNAIHIAFLESNVPKNWVTVHENVAINYKFDQTSTLVPNQRLYYYGTSLAVFVRNEGGQFASTFCTSFVQDWGTRPFPPNDHLLNYESKVYQRPTLDPRLYPAPWLLRVINSDKLVRMRMVTYPN
jgi:hypothetical protein